MGALMTYMSINEFNKNISAAIARVELGEELILTRRGKEVAFVSSREMEAKMARKKAAVDRLMDLFKQGPGFDGPATYEERTER
jgi:antitoxin (DNA-binding transcriptional repressor) of toxin-antitoxin stability system